MVQFGVELIGTVLVPLFGQPALVTVTFSVTEPLEPAVKAMLGVPWPLVIVPLVMDQA